MSGLQFPVSSFSPSASQKFHTTPFWGPKRSAQNHKYLCFHLKQSKNKAVCLNWITGNFFSCKKNNNKKKKPFFKPHSFFLQSVPDSHPLLGWPYVSIGCVTLFKIKCFSRTQSLSSHILKSSSSPLIAESETLGAPMCVCLLTTSWKNHSCQ